MKVKKSTQRTELCFNLAVNDQGCPLAGRAGQPVSQDEVLVILLPSCLRLPEPCLQANMPFV